MEIVLIIAVVVISLHLILDGYVVAKDWRVKHPKVKAKRKYTKRVVDANVKRSKGAKSYWMQMTPAQRKAESQRRAIVALNNKLAKEKGLTPTTPNKRTGWQKKRISNGIKKYWDNLTPEARQIRLDKLRRGRELKLLLKENKAFHMKGEQK